MALPKTITKKKRPSTKAPRKNTDLSYQKLAPKKLVKKMGRDKC